jgi:hypothetical protein
MGVYCGIYKGSYNVSNISYLNSLPPKLSFILPLILGIVSTGINFAFMDMCTHILHRIDPPTYFLYHHPLPLVPAYPYPCEGLVHPPVLKFCRRKKIKDINKKTTHFLLFEIKVFTKGISL